MNPDSSIEEKGKPKVSWKIQMARIGAIIFVVGLTILLYIYRSKVRQLGAFGYPGIFLVSILANATIILPVPGILITSAMGAIFNPFWVAVAAGAGAASVGGALQRPAQREKAARLEKGVPGYPEGGGSKYGRCLHRGGFEDPPPVPKREKARTRGHR